MKKRTTEKESGIVSDYNRFVELATIAVNKYELNGKYDASNKSVCLHIMDMQIKELRVINAAYVSHANSERGLRLRMHPQRFYEEFIKNGLMFRNKLEQEIKQEREALEAELAMKWDDHLKRDIKTWWNGFKEKIKIKAGVLCL